MTFYQQHIAPLMKQVEAGYVDHPSDRGGKTNHGITEAVARLNGYTGRMEDMPTSFAHRVLEQEYVIKPGFINIAPLSVKVAVELVDTGVNCGQSVAGRFFQRALNVFNGKGAFYPDIAVDGQIGKQSAASFKAYLAKRGALGETVMLRALNSLQGHHYVTITEGREANEDFAFGWFANRVVI